MSAAPSYPHSGGRIFLCMTRTQTRTYGVLDPSTRQPLLAAMLRAFCWLVSNVGSVFGLILNRTTRAWHADKAEGDQLPTPNDTQKRNLVGPRADAPRPAVDAQSRDHTCCASPLRHDAPHRATSPGPAGGGRHALLAESPLAKGGGGGSPRLRSETEGAVFTPAIPRVVCARGEGA
jgi:hypothetical protein